jgi:hypothetical protein
MECDRCGRTIEGGTLVSLGARRPFRNLCRTCWGVETRSSNTRLISALNEMTRGLTRQARPGRDGGNEGRVAQRADRRRMVEERRGDPERPRWHP